MCGIAKNILSKNRQKQLNKSNEKNFLENTNKLIQNPYQNNSKDTRHTDIYYIDNTELEDNISDIYVVDPPPILQQQQQRAKKNHFYSSNLSLSCSKQSQNEQHQHPNWMHNNYYNTGSYDDMLDRYGNYIQQGDLSGNGKHLYHSRTLPRNFMKRSIEDTNNTLNVRRISVGELSEQMRYELFFGIVCKLNNFILPY